jgi:Flp pilus assembly pilin Flp
MVVKKGGERTMEFLKRLVVEEEGQGLVEYTLIVLLVALVFWVAVRKADVGTALSTSWGSVTTCLTSPFSCAGGS